MNWLGETQFAQTNSDRDVAKETETPSGQG
jgi:hypothetical protein